MKGSTDDFSLWNDFDDTFEHADPAILAELATWVGMTCQDFDLAFKQRIDCLQELSQDSGVDPREMLAAIDDFRHRKKRP